MAFYPPLNIIVIILFLFGIVWGWEGQEERQFFAVLSSIFMFPLWFAPLITLVQSGNAIIVVRTASWLPTFLLVNILWWNVTLMYFTGAHLMQTLGRSEPIGNAIKKLRKLPRP